MHGIPSVKNIMISKNFFPGFFLSFLLGTECVPGLAIIKSKHYKKISQNAQTLSALIMLFCSLLMKKDKDYVTYLLDILIFLAPKKIHA